MPTNDQVIRRGGGSPQARHKDCPICNEPKDPDEYPSLQEDLNMEKYYEKKYGRE